MNMHSKNELTASVAPRYQCAGKLKKGQILDEYCQNTGFNRKYAIRKLQAELICPYARRKDRPRRRRPTQYGEIRWLVKKFWEAADYCCGWRLKAVLPTLIDKSTTYGEIAMNETERALLGQVSSATIDRMLVGELRLRRKKTNSQTHKGKVNGMIPFAIDQAVPTLAGILEIDLVAHCGGCAVGTFINTLSTTDFVTGWQESEAIMGKSKEAVREGLTRIKERLPFPLKGIDFDSGSEFVNDVMLAFSQEMRVALTKSRPYKKNDNAHIEQKNWTNVRRILGYCRFDSEAEQALMNDLYRNELRLYINFFLPSGKLISKERVGSKIKRKYDKPQTPYERILAREDVEDSAKQALIKTFDDLNPFELRRRIDKKLALLVSLAQKKGAA